MNNNTEVIKNKDELATNKGNIINLCYIDTLSRWCRL